MGIDPGRRGGLALLDTEDLSKCSVWEMPKSIPDLCALLQKKIIKPKVVVLEMQTTFGNEGRKSLASFMRHFGNLEGVIGVFSYLTGNYKLSMPKPAVWKKEFHLSSDKEKSADMASELWPELAVVFRRPSNRAKAGYVLNDGLAEAALLAYWGHIHFEDIVKNNLFA